MNTFSVDTRVDVNNKGIDAEFGAAQEIGGLPVALGQAEGGRAGETLVSGSGVEGLDKGLCEHGVEVGSGLFEEAVERFMNAKNLGGLYEHDGSKSFEEKVKCCFEVMGECLGWIISGNAKFTGEALSFLKALNAENSDCVDEHLISFLRYLIQNHLSKEELLKEFYSPSTTEERRKVSGEEFDGGFKFLNQLLTATGLNSKLGVYAEDGNFSSKENYALGCLIAQCVHLHLQYYEEDAGKNVLGEELKQHVMSLWEIMPEDLKKTLGLDRELKLISLGNI